MGMAAADPQFHVLAVDDSLIDRKLIERLLKTSSYQVTTVDSGNKALEFLGWHDDDDEKSDSNETCVSPKNHQEVGVNLVITDYCMPGMTGYDLLKKMKESSYLKNIPVVIMSSENVPSRINRCLEEGAEEFFLKPVRLSDVNKLRPHIMKTTKSSNVDDIHEKPEKQEEKLEATEETQSQLLQQQQQQQQQHTPQSNNVNNSNSSNDNNKRKSTMDEGLSPDRRRPRINGLIVMSN